MKIQAGLLLLGVLAMGVSGLAPQQQYLITYPKDAPQSDLDDYKNAIAAAGGQILHEYELIKSVPHAWKVDDLQVLTTSAEVSLSRLRHKLSIPFIPCPKSMRQPLRKTRLYIYKTKDYEAIQGLGFCKAGR